MRAALRLFASVQKGSQYLEAGAPTGLTGLLTHASPRSTLLYLYRSTLDRLEQFPESSVYRQSVEALVKHRMTIVENIKPAGLEEWQKRVAPTVDAHPEAFKRVDAISGNGFNILWKEDKEPTAAMLDGSATNFKASSTAQEAKEEWDKLKKGFRGKSGFVSSKAMHEGPREAHEVSSLGDRLSYDAVEEDGLAVRIEPEPQLTATQIGEIEQQIGAGLIEEVIMVAEGEKQLADTLYEAKVWEDLEEKPAPGQWQYNERDTHTPETQSR